MPRFPMHPLPSIVAMALVLGACGGGSGEASSGDGGAQDATGPMTDGGPDASADPMPDGGDAGSSAPPDAAGTDGGPAPDAGGTDAGPAPDASTGECGMIGQACEGHADCGEELRCGQWVEGICLPPTADCGGVAGKTCPGSAPECMYCDGCDFGPCLTAAQAECVCSTPTGRDKFPDCREE